MQINYIIIIYQLQKPTYNINMKPIQIMMDEKLLDELDAEEEVRRPGRSK